MYQIARKLGGSYVGTYRLRDSTERFEVDTLEEAILTMIDAAWYGHHAEIDEGHIRFVEEVRVARPETEVVLRELRIHAPDSMDLGAAEYPPGLKGLLLRLADRL